ncbi:hypothetical protein AN958_11117 [Leucoagaricus sp. SymC.cos]|nr:hypothetical protein AN958_11117 [Leucoagaricus sp. SymC.cos]
MSSQELSVSLTRGLEGRDADIDLLSQLFEQSQTVTVETADPMLDLISFAQDCTNFWVINASCAKTQPVETPLSEWPSEEFTNSLGLYPSHPSGSYEPTPSIPEGTDDTPLQPLTVDPERQRRFSDYLDTAVGATPAASNATEQHAPISPARSAPLPVDPSDGYEYRGDKNIAGFAYLLPSSAYPDALHFQEYNIGIILRPEWMNRGVAQRALYLVLDLVFSQPTVHRVQGQLIDCYKNSKALTLFTRMGFSHEGTRRQGFLCPLTAEWKDVTTFALLVTDWIVYVRDRAHAFQSAPKSLWDALFVRHQREREELLRWEDKCPHRTSSLETIRDGAATPTPSLARELDTPDSECGTASESEGSVVERPKRKLFEIGDGRPADASDAYDASSSECESEYESAVEGSPTKRMRSRMRVPSSATRSACTTNIDWTNANLGSVSGNARTFVDEMGEGQHDGVANLSVLSRSGLELAPSVPGNILHRDHENLLDDHNRSPSFSPEPSEGSIATVPPSDSDSEFELEDGGYTTSSATESSSPTGWELVNSDDDFRSSP